MANNYHCQHNNNNNGSKFGPKEKNKDPAENESERAGQTGPEKNKLIIGNNQRQQQTKILATLTANRNL